MMLPHFRCRQCSAAFYLDAFTHDPEAVALACPACGGEARRGDDREHIISYFTYADVADYGFSLRQAVWVVEHMDTSPFYEAFEAMREHAHEVPEV